MWNAHLNIYIYTYFIFYLHLYILQFLFISFGICHKDGLSLTCGLRLVLQI